MNLRFVEYGGGLYVVVGFCYESAHDPPECYVAVPLQDSVFKSVLCGLNTVKIPFTLATEITDKKKIEAIMVLYASKL